MPLLKTCLVTLITAGRLAACAAAPKVAADRRYGGYAVPQQTQDGWQTGPLPDQGITPAPISAMLQAIRENKYTGISSVLVARHHVLVLDEYFGAFTRDTIHNTSSAAKSITSALVGIAIDKGFIPSVQARVLPYFPEYDHQIAHWDNRKADISIADILSMSSGMKCDEDAMYDTDDWVKFYLDQPMFASPGKAFSYNS